MRWRKFRIPVFISLFLVGILGLTVIVLRQQTQTVLDASEIISCASIPAEQIGERVAAQSSDRKSPMKTDVLKLVREYRDSSREQRVQLRPNLRDALSSRKRNLVETMRRNPKDALLQIQAEGNTAEIASVSQNCSPVEKRVKGSLLVQAVDFDDKTGEEVYTLSLPDNKSITLHTPEKYPTMLYSGAQIQAEGYQLDQDFLMADASSFSVSSNTPPLMQQAAAFAPRNIAIILVNFTDTTRPSVSPSQVSQAFLSDVVSFHEENSYGRVRFLPSVYGWYQLPMPLNCSDTSAITNAAMEAANNEINFLNVQHVMISGPFDNCSWGGLGDLGTSNRNTPDGRTPVSISFTLIHPTFIVTGFMMHELGHNLGAGHASFGSDAYGDIYDIMGTNRAYMNAPHKETIGVLSDPELQTVIANGTYSIVPIEQQGGGVKALKINAGNAGIYYVEYRQPIGFDSVYNGSEFDGVDVFDGALIHKALEDSGTTDTLLIDPTTPQSAETSALKVNQSYTIPGTPTMIKVTGRTSSALTVSVSGIQAIPTNTPTPTVSSERTISGNLFIDNNANAIRDTGDYVYTAPTQMVLRRSDGSLVAETTSKTNGTYSFTTISSGSYELFADVASSYEVISSNPVVFSVASSNITIDFGLLEMPTSAVSPTLTRTPTPTRTPSPSLTRTPTPIRTPSPSVTRTPIPTSPILTISPTPSPMVTQEPNATTLSLPLVLHGIGVGGDRTNPNGGSFSNKQPIHQVRRVVVGLYKNNALVKNVVTTANYIPSEGVYRGIAIIAGVQPGNYDVQVDSDQYLTTRLPQVFIASSQTVVLPQVVLVAGDIVSDNVLDILDYNAILSCFEKKPCTKSRRDAADLTDDGRVDGSDYNLFLRNI